MAARKRARYTNALVANNVIGEEFGIHPTNKGAKQRLQNYERYQEKLLTCDQMTREKWSTLSKQLKYIWVINFHIGPPRIPKLAITALSNRHVRSTRKLIQDAVEYYPELYYEKYNSNIPDYIEKSRRVWCTTNGIDPFEERNHFKSLTYKEKRAYVKEKIEGGETYYTLSQTVGYSAKGLVRIMANHLERIKMTLLEAHKLTEPGWCVLI